MLIKWQLNKIQPLLILFFLFLLPLQVWNSIAFPALTSKIIFGVGSSTVFLIFLLTKLLEKEKKRTFRITYTDVVLTIATIYALIHSLWIKPYEKDTFLITEVLCLISLYLVIRSLRNLKILWIFLAFIASLAVVSVWGLMQYFSVLPSYNTLFPITGPFFNPAPYGAYLATGISVLGGLLIALRKLKVPNAKWRDVLLFLIQCIVIVTLLMLYLSKSRAAYLAALVSVVYLVLKSEHWIKNNRSQTILPKHKPLIKYFIITIVLFAFVWLGAKSYRQRTGSVHGRFLIWKCTTHMIVDHPFSGVGIGRFKANYMFYQANFLDENPDSELALKANNTIFGFNEYLETGSEVGLPGLIIFLLVPLSVFMKGSRSGLSVHIARAGILSLMTFACFSYPGSVLPLKVLFVVFMAIVSGRQCALFAISTKWLKFTGFLVIPVLLGTTLVKTVQLTEACLCWRTGNEYSMNMPDDQCIDKFKKAYPVLKNNGFFMGDYAYALIINGMYAEAIPILKETISIIPSTDTYINLGHCFAQTGQTCDAEDAYIFARYLIPARATPVLGLAKLYLQTERKQDAIALINKYFAQRTQKKEPATFAIEKEIKEIQIRANQMKQ